VRAGGGGGCLARSLVLSPAPALNTSSRAVGGFLKAAAEHALRRAPLIPEILTTK